MADEIDQRIAELEAKGLSLDEILQVVQSEPVPKAPMTPVDAANQARQPGVLDRLGALALKGADAAVEGVKKIPGAIGAYFDDFNNEISAGLIPKAYRAINPILPKSLQYPDQATTDQWQREHPVASVAGKASGLAPWMMAGGGPVSAARSALAPAVAPKVGTRLATAAGDAAVMEGARATGEGRSPAETAVRALTAATLGTVGQGAAEGLGKMVSLIRSDPMIAKYLRGKAEGVYDRGNLAGLSKGDKGVQEISEIADARISAKEAQLQKQASDEYWAELTPEELAKPIDKQKLLERLGQGRQQSLNPDKFNDEVGQLPLNPKVTSRFDRAINETPQAVFGPKGAEAPAFYMSEKNPATVAGTLARRRALKKESAPGSANRTEEQDAALDVYQDFRAAVHEAAPVVKSADTKYSKYAKGAERRRDIRYNTEDQVVQSGRDLDEAIPVEHADDLAGQRAGETPEVLRPRVGKEQRAVTLMSRYGDTNVPGQRAQRYLEELADADPEFLAALEDVALKKALNATRISFREQVPTTLTGATSLGGLMPLIRQNARAAGTKLVEPFSEGAMAARAASRLTPLLRDPADAVIDGRKRRKQQQEKELEELMRQLDAAGGL